MSTREISMGATRPIPRASYTADTQADWNFNTWSSFDRELASHRASPHVVKPRSLRVALRKKAHALFPAVSPAFKSLQLPQPLLDVLAIAVAVVFGLSGGLSIIVFFAMLFLMKF